MRHKERNKKYRLVLSSANSGRNLTRNNSSSNNSSSSSSNRSNSSNNNSNNSSSNSSNNRRNKTAMFQLIWCFFFLFAMRNTAEGFGVGLSSEHAAVNTFELIPPKARQILYSDGTPDIIPINEGEEAINLPLSTNPYGQWIIINTKKANIYNFATNKHKNVIINNAIGRVDVEYSSTMSKGNPVKIFDNTGTLHLKEPNDYNELPPPEP